MKNAGDIQALKPYERILARALEKLDIRTPFSLKSGDAWYFDMAKNRERIVLTCPPFKTFRAPALLHYLCHAKILEEGWLLPVTKTKGISTKDSFYFFTLNRAIDHFFDYYAWLLVIKTFGKNPVLTFSEQVARATPKLIVQNLEAYNRFFGVKYPSCILALDWFVLFPILASFVNHKREQQLHKLFRKLCRRTDFAAATTPAIERKTSEIGAFFLKLLRAYPTHTALLKNLNTFKGLYRTYYKMVWKNINIRSKIVDFY